MALPKTGSRTICIDNFEYRWMVRKHKENLNLAIQSATGTGQRLLVYLYPHQLYRRGIGTEWTLVRQLRVVSDGSVRRLIHHALRNGWKPQSMGIPPMKIYHWKAEEVLPQIKLPESSADEIPIKDIAMDQVSDLRLDISLDSDWRKLLFSSRENQKFEIPPSFYGLNEGSREHNLHFQAFNSGRTLDGDVVFGIQSVEFPAIVMYTTNNPGVL